MDVHAGAIGSHGAGGSGVDGFPAGTPFTTAGGDPSRRIPSWYYGDGARLFNQVQQQFATEFGVSVPAIVPLDPVLTTAAARRARGLTLGVRITRRLTPRYSIEIGIDHARSPLQVTGAARAAIEATNSSFEEAFTGLLSTAPIADLNVASTPEFNDDSGHQTSVTGAMAIDLMRRGRVATYVVAGGGLLTNGGGDSEVRLRGVYQFSLFGVVPYHENDSVTMRFVDRRQSAIGIVGGGVTYDLRARQAVRVDVRAQVGPGGARTVVITAAAHGRGTPVEVLPTATSPSVQFSTVDGHRSSLMPGSTELQTFTGSGFQARVQVTVGYLFRF